MTDSTNIRAIATNLIAEVMLRKRSLQQIFVEHTQGLSKADSAFVQALTYGVLREYGNLLALVKQLLDKPLKPKDLDLAILIAVGLYQLIAMRVPEHAAVSETVNAAKVLDKQWAVGLINGILRHFARDKDALIKKAHFNAAQNHPTWLVAKIKAAWPDRSLQIMQKNDLAPPMHLRVNQQKISREAYLTLLAEANIAAKAHEISSQAITLDQAIDVNQLPHFFEGYVSVQDIAAQQAAGLLELKPNIRVLDACAAPGGKTAHILETEPSVELLALDQDANRLKRVQETFTRLNLNAKLLVADASDASWWDQQSFERILLDAPCSATGVIRRHPDIKWLRQESDIAALSELQLKILTNLWAMLAEGGILIYATCSILPEENDRVIKKFLANQPDAKPAVIQFPKGCKTDYGWQFFPEFMGTDGFYYCKLSKQ